MSAPSHRGSFRFFLSDVVFVKQHFLASVSECGTPEPWKEGPSSEGFDRNFSSSEGLDPTPPISPPGGRTPQLIFPRSYQLYVCRELFCPFQSGISLLTALGYGLWSRRGCARLMSRQLEQLEAPFPPRSTAAASLLWSRHSGGLVCWARARRLSGPLVGLPVATAVDCALSLDLTCAIGVVCSLFTAKGDTCPPGGVQGNGLHRLRQEFQREFASLKPSESVCVNGFLGCLWFLRCSPCFPVPVALRSFGS